ncbi:MAG: acetyl-CoA C-acyltransferase [Anaerolineales bacterium]|nr:acetyl-CoA C-acyltransferase [Anaerolineales bacterium]
MNHLDASREPVIVAAVRTPIGKAKRGGLATVRPDDMAALVISELLKKVPSLEPAEVDDVILGCAFPEGEQGMNMARLVALRAGLPSSVPAETINRFCSSGMQSIAHGVYAIMAGQSQVIIAGGTESMSMVPMTGIKFAPMPYLAENNPAAFTAMGLTAENVAAQYGVSRQDQDAFALRSNQKASAAVESGRFDPELVPVEVSIVEPGDGVTRTKTFVVRRDEGPRADTSLEALAKLRPAFKEGGTVTAGNSSQMSDGAAAVVVMSRAKAESLGLKPLVRFISYAVGGVPPEVMGLGPIAAVPKALKYAGLALKDIGLIELNEAFASQGLAVMRELNLDPEITNVNGGAIALGHPLGCTGAKLTTQMIFEMKRRDVQFGLVTMCIGGGMGAAGVFENLP